MKELREQIARAIFDKQPPPRRPWADLSVESWTWYFGLADAVLAAIEASGHVLVPASGRYRHKKRGTTYQLLGEASVQSNNAIFEGEPVVLYRADSDGTLWVRPHYEFNDGRFELLAARPRDAAPSHPAEAGERRGNTDV